MNPQPKHKAKRLEPHAYKKLQKAVWKRDGGRCAICGARLLVTAHHIKPRGQGGEDTAENLITLCHVCHHEIHDGKVEEYRKLLKQALQGRPGRGAGL